MKKIFGVALAWILVSTVSFAQQATVQSSDTADKAKTCIPTKECAAKAGMTLEECKKICKAGDTAKASTTNVASASLVADTKEAKKACCVSMKDCAAKMGMTVAECKAKCDGKSKTALEDTDEDNNTKVASAVLVNQVEEVSSEKSTAKKCCKSASACSKKKN